MTTVENWFKPNQPTLTGNQELDPMEGFYFLKFIFIFSCLKFSVPSVF
jgi:hypothetical protein